MSGTFIGAGHYNVSGGALRLSNTVFNGESITVSGTGELDVTGNVDPLASYTMTGGTLRLDDVLEATTVNLLGGAVVNEGGIIRANSLVSDIAMGVNSVDGSTLTSFAESGQLGVYGDDAFFATFVMNGHLTLGAGSQLGLGNYSFTALAGALIPLLRVQSLTGTFATTSVVLPDQWSVLYRTLDDGDVEVDLANLNAVQVATPEPGTGSLLLLGGLSLLVLMPRLRSRPRSTSH
jgi:hypothetical protein